MAFFFLREGEGIVKTVTLCLNKDFRTLYYHGKSRVHPLLVTYARRNKVGYPRIGITTGKKIGGAVQRSRSRRVIREAFRLQTPAVAGGWDLVFVARARTAAVKSTEIGAVMAEQLAALGVVAP